jgi:hypothetical protein
MGLRMRAALTGAVFTKSLFTRKREKEKRMDE